MLTTLREVRAGTYGRNLETGMEAETIEEYAYWLAPHGFLCLLFHIIADHLARAGTTRSELGPTTSIVNQENAPQAYP